MVTVDTENRFSEIENTISFWTRNDFSIANNLLVGNYANVWIAAKVAYDDNKQVLKEYNSGERTVDGDYDIKWINALNSRLINSLDNTAKGRIVNNAINDICNILSLMAPADNKLLLYHTAWENSENAANTSVPFSRQYSAMQLHQGDMVDIKIITSASLTPYRESELDCKYYRYEITVPRGAPVLALEQFVCHNEEGEILLPPMKCIVKRIRSSMDAKCGGVIEMEFLQQLPVEIKAEYYIQNRTLIWDYNRDSVKLNNLYIDKLWNMRDAVGCDDMCVGVTVDNDNSFKFWTFNGFMYSVEIKQQQAVCTKRIFTK